MDSKPLECYQCTSSENSCVTPNTLQDWLQDLDNFLALNDTANQSPPPTPDRGRQQLAPTPTGRHPQRLPDEHHTRRGSLDLEQQ